MRKSMGSRTSTRTDRPMTRAGRNSARRTYDSAGASNARCRLSTIRSEPGSARPNESITTSTTTRPSIPVCRISSG